MSKRKEVQGLNIALLDILTGALGAVIILYVAVPKVRRLSAKLLQEQQYLSLKKRKLIFMLRSEVKSKG